MEVLDRIVCVCVCPRIFQSKKSSFRAQYKVHAMTALCLSGRIMTEEKRSHRSPRPSKFTPPHACPTLWPATVPDPPVCVRVCVRDRNHRNALLWSVLSVGSACESCLVITGCSENAQSYLLTHQKIAPWW